MHRRLNKGTIVQLNMLTTDKAYIFGLMVGGAQIGASSFSIRLPYKKWGDISHNTVRAADIMSDILNVLNPIMQNTYGVNFAPSIGTDWRLNSNSFPPALQQDLQEYGLKTSGELRSNSSIQNLLPHLISLKHKQKFITGLIDTVGSLARSHRRFVDTFQVVSFEFKGQNFGLVSEVYSLFQSMNIPVDQVLWNHPNQHSTLCKYYKSWKKGFKIRVSLQDYLLQGGFVFKAKKLSADENSSLNANNSSAALKPHKLQGRVTVHLDQNTTWIPPHLRGLVFPHQLWFNVAQGLNINPSGKNLVTNTPAETLFCPFTILTKRTTPEISDIINNDKILSRECYDTYNFDIKKVITVYEKDNNQLLFGKTNLDGFPINYMLQAAAFASLSTLGEKMKGNRVLGNYLDNLKELISTGRITSTNLTLSIPKKGTALRITSGNYSALVGYTNNSFNKKLVLQKANGLFSVSDFSYEDCAEIQ